MRRNANYVICSAILLLFSGISAWAVLPAASSATIRLTDPLSTGSSQPGDTFTAILESPLVVSDRIVAEAGTRVIGQVISVTSSGRLQRPAMITVRLIAVDDNDARFQLRTGDLTVKEDSHAPRNILIIGGSAASGAVMGASGGGRGALLGGLLGAGAGTAGAYLTGKKEIVLPSETLLTFHVNSVQISARELARLQRVRVRSDHEPRLRDRHEFHCHSHHHEHDEDGYRRAENHEHEDEDECEDRDDD